MNPLNPKPAPEDKKVLFGLKGITKLYPGTVALNNINFNIREGECHGIIGKNGAGKTTLVKIISGVIAPTKGEIITREKTVSHLTRKRAKDLGISIVTQEPQIIPEFTVAENLVFPDYLCLAKSKIKWNGIFAKAKNAITEAGFDLDLKKPAGDLSVSEQQLLLVVKAFFVDKNSVVILDEVTTALSRKDEEFLFKLIEHQKQHENKAILFISHRMDEIIRICDRITVLRDSRKITTQDPKGLSEEDLSRLIVGENYDLKTKPQEKAPEACLSQPKDCLISIEDLTCAGKFKKINLELNRGEILGLAGLRGSGRTDLLKCIIGSVDRDFGSISYKGEKVNFANPGKAMEKGIAYLPEDRDLEGLIEIASVKNNITLSSLKQYCQGFRISASKEKSIAQKLVKALNIKISTLDQEVRTLSGGNRQKVVIARLMASDPEVYLLDEPTKGIDIEAKRNILETVRKDLTKTSGIILTSPSVEDLMKISTRILVLHNGEIIKEFKKKDFDQNQIYLAMQGVK